MHSNWHTLHVEPQMGPNPTLSLIGYVDSTLATISAKGLGLDRDKYEHETGTQGRNESFWRLRNKTNGKSRPKKARSCLTGTSGNRTMSVFKVSEGQRPSDNS